MLSSTMTRLVRHTLHLSLALLTMVSLTSSAFSAPPTKKTVKATVKKDVKVNVQKTVDDGRIDINTATVEQLMTLKGIGKKRAEAIVKDREANGPFSSLMNLTRVKGIGQKTVENNSQKIKMGSAAPAGLHEHPTPNPNVK